MAILYDDSMKIIIQGPPGKEVNSLINIMQNYVSNIVACVYPSLKSLPETPIPWYISVEEACENHQNIETSLICSPPDEAKDLALEALYSSIGLTVLLPEEIPVYDCLKIAQEAEKRNLNILGPGSKGLWNPGIGLIGSLPMNTGFPSGNWLQTGAVAILTRSPSQALLVASLLKKENIGISSIIDLGSAEILLGLNFETLLYLLEKDPNTHGTVICHSGFESDYKDILRAVEKGKYAKPLLTILPKNKIANELDFQDLSFFDIKNQFEKIDITIINDFDFLVDKVREKIHP